MKSKRTNNSQISLIFYKKKEKEKEKTNITKRNLFN